MKYDVQWQLEAQEQLALIWLDALDQRLVTQSISRIEAELVRDPRANSEHLSEGLYRIRLAPLSVFFEINPGDRIVDVVFIRSG